MPKKPNFNLSDLKKLARGLLPQSKDAKEIPDVELGGIKKPKKISGKASEQHARIKQAGSLKFALMNSLSKAELDKLGEQFPGIAQRAKKNEEKNTYKIVVGRGAGGSGKSNDASSGGVVRLAQTRSAGQGITDDDKFIAVKKIRYNPKAEIDKAAAEARDLVIKNHLKKPPLNGQQIPEGYNYTYTEKKKEVLKELTQKKVAPKIAEELAEKSAREEAAQYILQVSTAHNMRDDLNQEIVQAEQRAKLAKANEIASIFATARKEYYFHRDHLAQFKDLDGLYVPIVAAAETEGKDGKHTVYQFMELADLGDGKNLIKVIKENKDKLTNQEYEVLMMHITESVIRAVIKMHEHKIFHRDLKAENFLASSDGKIRLTDFGSAQHDDFFVNNHADMRYMAPELRDPNSVITWEGCEAWTVAITLMEFYGVDLTQYFPEAKKANFDLSLINREGVPEWAKPILDVLLVHDATNRRSLVDVQDWLKTPDKQEQFATNFQYIPLDQPGHQAQIEKIIKKMMSPKLEAASELSNENNAVFTPPASATTHANPSTVTPNANNAVYGVPIPATSNNAVYGVPIPATSNVNPVVTPDQNNDVYKPMGSVPADQTANVKHTHDNASISHSTNAMNNNNTTPNVNTVPAGVLSPEFVPDGSSSGGGSVSKPIDAQTPSTQPNVTNVVTPTPQSNTPPASADIVVTPVMLTALCQEYLKICGELLSVMNLVAFEFNQRAAFVAQNNVYHGLNQHGMFHSNKDVDSGQTPAPTPSNTPSKD